MEKEIFRNKFVDTLTEALGLLGPHTHYSKLIGGRYQFESECGSYRYILVGTIQAIEFTDEEVIFFFVSNPRFSGGKLDSIAYVNGKWGVFVIFSDSVKEFFKGNFTLIE